MRLDQALAKAVPEYSRNRIQIWIAGGRVAVDGRPATEVRQKVWGGEVVVLLPDECAGQQVDAPEEIPLRVVFENDEVLVLDKPAGLVVHPGSGNRSGTLLNALLHYAPAQAHLPRSGIVHRLDKDTSGLMVVAKSLAAQTSLVRQLQHRSVRREYVAIVSGVLGRDGVVDAPIGRDPQRRTRMAVLAAGREARTHFRVRECYERASLVECRLETGRTHQIRVHMASIGHPLVGDATYGGRAVLRWGFARQALHAWRLRLRLPREGQELGWESPLPSDMSELIVRLRTNKSA